MSCTKPSLMEVWKLNSRQLLQGNIERLEKQGWKVNRDTGKGYRFISAKSRELPLEDIEAWQSQEIIELPCGCCTQCRLDYAKDWAIRCQFEAKLWKHNIFLTLNYDNDHVPIGKYGNMTLDPKDIKRFINSLRRKFQRLGHTGVRYLICGEYNSSGERMLNPHYHMILFNCPLPDLTIDIPDGKGHIIHKINDYTHLPYMFSQFVADCWQDDNGIQKGQVIIDDANYNTESYVTRYIMKKQKGENANIYEENFGVCPPFLRMSNKPGIGFNMFINEYEQYVDAPLVMIPRIKKKALITGLPKYYKRKMFEVDPSLRDKFEAQAKQTEIQLRTLRKHYGHTSNYQKGVTEAHADAVASLFNRNNA